MKRLDVFLTDLGLAPSRTKAKELIKDGAVSLKAAQGDWVVVTNPSHGVDEVTVTGSDWVRVKDHALMKYVSRGGLKLEGALKQVGLSVQGFKVLDVGQSTGGFTDCLLKAGAASVVGIDVGHDQLVSMLRTHPRVQYFEGLHVKDLDPNPDFQAVAQGGFDLVVVDVSFISLSQILPILAGYLKSEGLLLALVKPQFELGATALNKKGVVKDTSLYNELQDRIQVDVTEQGLRVLNYFDSPIRGQDGNREFFIYAKMEGRAQEWTKLRRP